MRYAVLRWAADVPQHVRDASPGFAGRWLDSATLPVAGPALMERLKGEPHAYAEPADPPRIEYRDRPGPQPGTMMTEVAEVWEIHLVEPETRDG